MSEMDEKAKVLLKLTQLALKDYLNKDGEVDEDSCLRAIESDCDSIKWNAALALADVGTNRSIEALKALCGNSSFDVQSAATSAIGAISPETEIDFLVGLLEEKSFRANHAVMIVAERFARASHVEVIWTKVKGWLKKPPKTPIQLKPGVYTSEVLLGLSCLNRLGALDEAKKEMVQKYIERQPERVVGSIKALIR